MKTIMISSDKSSGGKTTFTLCLMAAMKKLGFKVQGYKCGPDYIDTGFHTIITGIPGRNIDEFLQGEEAFSKSLENGEGDIGIIEGVMGFYDGLSDGKYSAWDISEKLKTPVILVLNPKGQALTFAAVIKGLTEFRKNNIRGIVLSMVSEKYYTLLKGYIEKETDIEVLGYMPKLKELEFSSRHLGLIQGSETENLKERIEKGSEELLKTVDTGRILSIMEESYMHKEEGNTDIETDIENHIGNGMDNDINNDTDNDIDYDKDNEDKSVRFENNGIPYQITGETVVNGNGTIRNKPVCAYALDEAFSFYYKDSLDELKEHFSLVPFSPLRDNKLPECSFLYIGGGYPEVFKNELSENESLLKDIREKLQNGLPCYAECGGLMYLTHDIEGSKMVGFLDGSVIMTKTLQHFGYCRVRFENELLPQCEIPAHEFHKSVFETDMETASEITGESSGKTWTGGYVKNKVYAQYAHINLKNAPRLMDRFTELAEEYENIRNK